MGSEQELGFHCGSMGANAPERIIERAQGKD